MASGSGWKNRADPGWKFVHPAEENNTNHTICNFCLKHMKGGITRAKEHLTGTSGNVSKCIKVPKEVKDELENYKDRKKKRQCSEESEAPNAIGKRNKPKLRQQNIREPCDNFDSVVGEVMKLQSVEQLLQIRQVAEFTLKHLTSMKQTSGEEMHTFESRSLQLQFENNISPPVFSGARIEGEDGSNLRIVLVDGLTEKVVSSGPESIAKVLEGDFEDRCDIWTPEKLSRNIVREREGQKPLLTGDVILSLKDGTGGVGKISFTDNSSSTRSRKFMPGEKVMDKFDGVRIREAKTESFIDGSSHLTNVLCSSNPPNTEGSSANKLLAPQETGGPSYTQASASSDIMSSIFSVGGTSGLDDFCFPVRLTHTDPQWPMQLMNIICS